MTVQTNFCKGLTVELQKCQYRWLYWAVLPLRHIVGKGVGKTAACLWEKWKSNNCTDQELWWGSACHTRVEVFITLMALTDLLPVRSVPRCRWIDTGVKQMAFSPSLSRLQHEIWNIEQVLSFSWHEMLIWLTWHSTFYLYVSEYCTTAHTEIIGNFQGSCFVTVTILQVPNNISHLSNFRFIRLHFKSS